MTMPGLPVSTHFSPLLRGRKNDMVAPSSWKMVLNITPKRDKAYPFIQQMVDTLHVLSWHCNEQNQAPSLLRGAARTHQ